MPPARTVADAADVFLTRATAVTTRRSYGQTMKVLTAAYGDRPIDGLDGPAIAELTADSWGTLAPATWNRHVATLRSFTAFCRRTGWLQVDLCAGLERRPEKIDRTKAVADISLQRLFRREDVPIREKCLWRLLYETAARAQEVLSLNVEDVDLDNKRARTVSKGGDIEWLHFQSGSARLLPRIIAGRQTGPLFLAERGPAPARSPGRLPRHRTRTTVLRTRRIPVQAPLPTDQPHRADPAPAAALGPDHPRRRQRLPATADGQKPPQKPAIPAALRPPLRRSRRSDDRRPRPSRPTPPTLTQTSEITAVWGW